MRRLALGLAALSTLAGAQTYVAPAGIRQALKRHGPSILPGGRIIAPLGNEYVAGSGAFGLLVSPSAHTVVTANGGPGWNSLTVLERDPSGRWDDRQIGAVSPFTSGEEEDRDWRGVFMGLAWASDRSVFVSEGNSGRISVVDLVTQNRRRAIDLNQEGFSDSYTGDLALDPVRGILYAIDQANFRVAIIDTHTRQIIASVRTGRLPFALALSPDRRKLYVTDLGMFQYRSIPGADPARARETGLPFPAFGFPSTEAAEGVVRQTARGPVQVPGLGSPNTPQSNSVCVIDVADPAQPKVEAFVRTGLPFGGSSHSGSSPSGILAVGDRVFVSNAENDSITVIDARSNRVESEIPIRIPGLESLRGVLPIGMAWHQASGWLLVAEAGINAIAVIDTRAGRVTGHLPASWFPTRVAIRGDTVFVATAKGHGVGPNASGYGIGGGAGIREGSVAIFSLPRPADLAADTRFVLEANGFVPRPIPPPALPAAIRHVVLIVKENRTYDEVFGDIARVSNGPAMGAPELARFGTHGFADGEHKRLSIKDTDITPNHHAIALRWAFSDNFYADSDVSVDGHHWLVGAYPNAWTETSMMAAYSDQKKDFRLGAAPGRLLFAGSASSVHPEEQIEAGAIWGHLERHNVSFLNFGEGFELAGIDEGRDLEPTGARFLTNVPMPDALYRHTSRVYPGFNMNIPDQYRASQFISEIERRYVKSGQDLPQFIFVHLPDDHMANVRPQDGYPYKTSFVVDNDLALGRMVEYLSHTKWWPSTAIFITEDDAQGGIDHIDAHRTVLLCAGPWFKRSYVSHTNSSFPGLLKTIFELLHVPPLTLFDASAADLSDCFAASPSNAEFRALGVDKRIFDPAAARIGRGPSSTRMDDPLHIPGLPRQ